MPVPAQPQQATNGLGIFQNILKVSGSSADVLAAQAALTEFTPYVAAVYAAISVLPEGELKSWFNINTVDLWKRIWGVIFQGGYKKYTSGDYVLGERLNDQIYCNPNIGRQQVSDDMVDIAHQVFNQLFGVRIATSDDLDALERGFDAYKAREASQGISDAAINRAVFLKQHFFPASTYNTSCWDLRYFEIYPLVDRIPAYEKGKWYTGMVVGGAYAVDGLIPVSATDILDQYLGAKFDPVTGNVTTVDGTVITPGAGGAQGILQEITANPLLAIGAAVGIYFLYDQLEEQ